MKGRVSSYALAAVLFLVAFANAGTVTLTGTCVSNATSYMNNTGYVTFSIGNSGNDTASNLQMTPIFPGINFNSSGYPSGSIISLGPGIKATFRFNFAKVPINGSYSGVFSVKYLQGSSSFSAVFPCTVNVAAKTQSNLSITNIERNGSTINITLVNNENAPIDANLSVFIPSTLNVISNPTRITIAPDSDKNFSFNIPQFSGFNSATIGLVADYVQSDEMHSYISSYSILGQQPSAAQSQSSQSDVPALVAVAVAAVLIIALIIISVAKNMKRK